MPLVPNDTDGAISRKRIQDWVAAREKTVVVAAADENTTQSAATLVASKVVYTMTPTANRTLTTPTGAQLGAAVADEAVGFSFEFTVVNLASATHTITLTDGGDGISLVGDAVVEAATSSTFVGVVTAADTVVVYKK
jgi:hypothetical protein